VLLAGLPFPYDSFVTSVTQSLRSDKVNIEDLYAQVIDEGSRVNSGTINGTVRNLALRTEERTGPTRTGPMCWHCGIVGHKEEQC
jgi:hypothetical protein